MSTAGHDGAHQALVIPADPTLPVRVMEYANPGDVTRMIRSEIGCHTLDLTPQLPSRFGRFVLWVDDNGLNRHPVEHNDRAIALCRASGYDVADLARTAVVTGMDATGNVRSVPPGLRDWLLEAFGRLRDPRAVPEQDQRTPTTEHDRRPDRRTPRSAHNAQPPAQRRDAAPRPAHDARRAAPRSGPPRNNGRPPLGPAPG